ncbi:MAG: OmpA family protein [Bacteroidota bacterium]
MKKKKLLCIALGCVVALFICPYIAYSQGSTVDAKKIKKLSKQGSSFLKKENYHQAIQFFNQILALDSNDVGALLYGGICNVHLHDNRKALDYLKKAYELDPNIDPFIHFLLGRTYHVNMQFDLAVSHYEQYRKTLTWLENDEESVVLLIAQARVGKKYQQQPTDYYVENMGAGVNSQYSDHSAILTGDRKSIVFTSTRTDNLSKKDVKSSGEAYEHTYTASRFFDGSWGSAEVINPVGNSNRKNMHLANSQFANNDQKLIFYNSSKGGSLSVSEKSGNGWSKPKPLSKQTNTRDYEANACIAKNGKTMYFASTRGTKLGDLDLFYCRLNPDSSWSEPIAMPAYINSEEDEDGPFLSDDGSTLYFSSKGHENMGGFDIFKTTRNQANGSWSRPINMGYPTNTPEDDIYFFTNDSTQVSYLSSNRMDGYGEEDIFNLRPLEEVMVKGLVSSASQAAMPGIEIVFVSMKDKNLGTVVVTGPNGVYGAKLRCRHRYMVNVFSNGQLIQSDELDIPLTNRENKSVIKDLQLKTSLVKTTKAASKLEINNLNLIKISYQEFDSLIIGGVITDNNVALSSAQIRIRTEASSEYEFSTTSDQKGHYEIAFIPGKRQSYVMEIEKTGYPLQHVAIVYVERNFQKVTEEESRNKNVNVIALNAQLTKPEVGATFVLGGVYFAERSDGLKKENYVMLDQLSEFLKANAGMKIELGGYTDNSNKVGENRVITQRWAQLVANYLIEKGIEKKRLVTKGYGEVNPVAPNSMAYNGRDVNRRIVVKILENKVTDEE